MTLVYVHPFELHTETGGDASSGRFLASCRIKGNLPRTPQLCSIECVMLHCLSFKAEKVRCIEHSHL